jgi:hypothetical protein
LPWTGVELFGLKGPTLGYPNAGAGVVSRETDVDKTSPTKRDIILARPGNTYEKLKRDSEKKRKAEEKRESKRVRKATKQSGGPAKPDDEPQ